MSKEPRIRWVACGEDHRDRKGTYKFYEVSIIHHHTRRSYTVEFYDRRYGNYPLTDEGLEAAKADALRLIPGWVAERQAEAQRYKDEAAENQRLYAAKQRRLEAAVESLRSVGIGAVDNFGVVALTVEEAEALAARLGGSALSAANRNNVN